MTDQAWKITVRGAPSTYEVAEYECPEHGRFTVSVIRPAPDVLRCELGESCPHDAVWCFPTPSAVKVSLVSFQRGRSGDLPPDDVLLNTRPLGDGMPMHEFQAHRRKITRDLNLKRIRALKSR